MVKNKLYFFLGTEVVYGTGFKVVEGIVGGSEDSQALRRGVELVFDLVVHLGVDEKANEGGVLAVFVEDSC